MITVVIKRDGARGDYLSISLGKSKAWVRIFHIACLLEIYKRFGMGIVTDGGELYINFSDEAEKYIYALLSLNSYRSRKYAREVFNDKDPVENILVIAIADFGGIWGL